MPCDGGYSYGNVRARQQAEREVRAKFPNLQKNSSGWYRAVENRYKRIK